VASWGGIPWFSMTGAAEPTLAAGCFRRVSIWFHGYIDAIITSGVDPVKLGLVASFIRPSHDGCKHGRPYALP
jgi:hypothetical protein